MHVVKQVAPDTYAPNRLTEALVEPKFRDGIVNK